MPSIDGRIRQILMFMERFWEQYETTFNGRMVNDDDDVATFIDSLDKLMAELFKDGRVVVFRIVGLLCYAGELARAVCRRDQSANRCQDIAD